MGYNYKDYILPSVPTFYGLSSTLASLAIVTKSFFGLPPVSKYADINLTLVTSFIGVVTINTFFLQHHFPEHTIPGKAFASTVCGLGGYAIYKVFNEAIDYVSGKFNLNLDNTDLIAFGITLGTITIAPKPLKDSTINTINKLTSLIEVGLMQLLLIENTENSENNDNVFEEEVDNILDENKDEDDILNMSTIPITKNDNFVE